MGDPGSGINATFDEKMKPEGYLPVVGELHYSTDCSYYRSKKEQSVLQNGKLAHGYTHTRYCTCRANLPQITPENHFSTQCKWSRVKDMKYEFDGDQKVYIYRKCVCQEPK